MTKAPKTWLNSQGEQVVEIGITGTRLGGSPMQLDIVRRLLEGKTGILHHGDCVGIDQEIHSLVRTLYKDKWRIVIHPPVKNEFRAFCLGDVVLEPKPYLDRNKAIVDPSNVFLAFPKDRSGSGGTWSTINYFRKVLARDITQKPPANPRTGTIIMPNGDIGHIMAERKQVGYG